MQERVIKILAEVINVPVDQINEDSTMETVENWDSLQHINLVLALEEEFDIKFTESEIVNLVSVKEILEAIKKKSDA